MATLWEKLTAQEVLGEFGREEVSTEEGHCEASGDQCDLDELFQDPKGRVRNKAGASDAEIAAVSQQNEFLEKFDRILEDSGKAFNPETEQVLTAELRLLRTLHEGAIWHLANDAWRTALLPVGGLIYVRSLEKYLWVLKTNECAALCWPAEQMELHMWRKAKVQELVWYTCFDFENVQVLQVEVLSPQSLMLQDLPVCYTDRCL